MQVTMDLRRQPRHGAASFTADDAEARYNCLLSLGFDEDSATKVFETVQLPAIDNIRGKLDDLKALGFENPVKMITSLPAILGYAIDNIRGKLDDLKALGFENPVKMITSSPAILGYAPARVRLVGGIVASLTDRNDTMFSRLISKRRELLEVVAASKPATWSEVRTILKDARAC